MDKKILLVLVASLLVKLIISLLTFHPDIRHFDLGGQVVSSGNILNLYDFATEENNALAKLNKDNLFNYPPAIYLLSGLFSLLFTPLVSQSFIIDFLADTYTVLGSFQASFHLLLLKLPYLFFDLAIGFILMRLFENRKEKILAFSLWMFNPINLYTTYMIGQFDIVPVFFVCLSLLFSKLGKTLKAVLSLGFGIAFKIFPLFLLIPLVLTQKNWLSRLKLIILGFLPYLILTLPFLFSTGFRNQALLASQTDKGFYAQILVSGGESIFIFPAILVFFSLIFLYKGVSLGEVWQKYLLVLFPFFIFTHFHAQWFLWMTPLLVIDLVKSNLKLIFLNLVMLFCWVGSLFFFDPSLTVGIFSPLFPILYNLPSLWEILGLNIDYNFSRSLLQTVFVSSALYYLYIYFPRKNET